jgi:hypothetical protein
MDTKTIITALMGYGKGPAIRYLLVALAWAFSGRAGYDSVKAEQFTQAAVEFALPLIVSLVCWAVGAVKRKALAEAEPPAKGTN